MPSFLWVVPALLAALLAYQMATQSITPQLHHPPTVVVVGAGLSGLAAATEADVSGARVIVLEQAPRAGGNSAKASSGVSAPGTAQQAGADIDDSAALFLIDTEQSAQGEGTPALRQALAEDAASAVAWLSTFDGVALDAITQCGGHSARRTHRPAKGMPVGMTLTKALAASLESTTAVQQTFNAAVESLVMSEDGARVQGVQLADGTRVMADAVVLTTGGFGAGGSLMHEFRPDLLDTSTTNGAQSLGDGMRMARAAGASLVDMEFVQLHPTGLVDPAAPGAKHKFLGPEALRAVGGALVNGAGERFVDELGRRDAVTAAIQAQADERDGNVVAWLVLDRAGAAEYPAVHFYKSKGLVTEFENAAAFGAVLGADPTAALEAYGTARAGRVADAFGRTVWGAATLDPSEPLLVMQVTPVVHYTMGGIATGAEGAVDGVAGLFAAGEATGGLHGANRLAGNSLLDCVVFGRRAGRAAAAAARARTDAEAAA